LAVTGVIRPSTCAAAWIAEGCLARNDFDEPEASHPVKAGDRRSFNRC